MVIRKPKVYRKICIGCHKPFKTISGNTMYHPECYEENKKKISKRNYIDHKKDTVKKERRFCIGVLCRGEKKFTSIGGARICKRCMSAIKGFQEHYIF